VYVCVCVFMCCVCVLRVRLLCACMCSVCVYIRVWFQCVCTCVCTCAYSGGEGCMVHGGRPRCAAAEPTLRWACRRIGNGNAQRHLCRRVFAASVHAWRVCACTAITQNGAGSCRHVVACGAYRLHRMVQGHADMSWLVVIPEMIPVSATRFVLWARRTEGVWNPFADRRDQPDGHDTPATYTLVRIACRVSDAGAREAWAAAHARVPFGHALHHVDTLDSADLLRVCVEDGPIQVHGRRREWRQLP